MKLHELKATKGSRDHKSKIVGRGHGSGMGKTSTRGQKGQWARKSGGPRMGFEGGQTPLFRRLPKFGFNNADFANTYTVVTLHELANLKTKEVNKEALLKHRLITSTKTRVKVIGNGKIDHAMNLEVDAISKGAAAIITAAGGKVNLVSTSK